MRDAKMEHFLFLSKTERPIEVIYIILITLVSLAYQLRSNDLKCQQHDMC